MKYPLSAMAALALCASQAHAQSNVTIYGTFDGSLRNQTNTTADGASKLSAGSNGLYLANRLGFMGTEDLGGGNRVKFMLEAGFNPGTGSLDTTTGVLFNRSAWVGLEGRWGSLKVGRQYTVAFQAAKDYEPFAYRFISLVPVGGGAGTTLPAAAIAAGLGASATSGPRLSNDIQVSRNFGALTVMAELAPGEQAGNSSNGRAQALGVKYAKGELVGGAAFTRKKTLAGMENTSYTVGGGMQIGKVQAKIGYAKERQATIAAGTYSNTVSWVGAVVPVSERIELIAGWYNTRYQHTVSGQRDLAIATVSYALSKRSRLFVEADRNRYRGALVPPTRQGGQTGISLGLNHSF